MKYFACGRRQKGPKLDDIRASVIKHGILIGKCGPDAALGAMGRSGGRQQGVQSRLELMGGVLLTSAAGSHGQRTAPALRSNTPARKYLQKEQAACEYYLKKQSGCLFIILCDD